MKIKLNVSNDFNLNNNYCFHTKCWPMTIVLKFKNLIFSCTKEKQTMKTFIRLILHNVLKFILKCLASVRVSCDWKLTGCWYFIWATGTHQRQKSMHAHELCAVENFSILLVKIQRLARAMRTFATFDECAPKAWNLNSSTCPQYTTKRLAILLRADHSRMPLHSHSRHRPLVLWM